MSKINNRVLSRKVAQIWGANGYFFQDINTNSFLECVRFIGLGWTNRFSFFNYKGYFQLQEYREESD